MKSFATPPRRAAKFLPLAAGLAILALTAGCSGIRLDTLLRPNENDWQLAGGSERRLNFTPVPVTPPLTAEWEYDASAGFGPSAMAGKDSVLFIGTLQGELQAVSLAKGDRLGWISLGSAIPGAPIVDGNNVIVVTSDERDNVISCDLRTGKKNWVRSAGPTDNAPLRSGELIIVTTATGDVTAFDKDLGDERWRFHAGRAIHGAPAGDGERIYFGCDDGRLRALDRFGKLLWTSPGAGPFLAGPVVEDSLVIAGSFDRHLYAFDARTGKLVWKTRVPAVPYGSVAVAGNRAVIGTSGEEVVCFDTHTGSILWSFHTGGVVTAAPLITGTIVYAPCLDKRLYAIDLGSGALLWKLEYPSRLRTTPVPWGRDLLVPTEERVVYYMKGSK